MSPSGRPGHPVFGLTRLSELKSSLAALSDRSLARLVERAAFKAFLLTDEEHVVLSEVVRERELDVLAVLCEVDFASFTRD